MTAPRWTLDEVCPADWASRVRMLGGGVFHTPAGLPLSIGEATPLYASLVADGRCDGIAVLARRRCRLAVRPRHLRAPSLPALAEPATGAEALGALAATLAEAGAADFVADGYDATWTAEPGGEPARESWEFAVPVSADEAAIVGVLSATHRRHWRRAVASGWTFAALAPEAAVAALEQVQFEASRRGAGHGNVFTPHVAREAAARSGPLGAGDWGAAVVAAREGDRLLAAALVGWGGTRAFYVAGGSTPEGYQKSAAVFLHVRAMAALGARGCTAYNLGGTPLAAREPVHPGHGLYRFKAGFGAEPVLRRGAGFVLRPWHRRLHAVAGFFGGA